MNKIQNILIVEELFSRLRKACEDGKEITLIAPFVKTRVVESLMMTMPDATPFTLITRWHPEDIARGVSDTTVFDSLMVRGNSELLLHQSLHAKVFLCGDCVFIGSANLTDAGLGSGQKPNVELTTFLRPVPTSVRIFVNRVLYESTIVTAQIKAAIDEQASRYADSLTSNEFTSNSFFDELVQDWRPRWFFPQLRSPDRLFSAYCDFEVLPVDVRENAWRDLAVLNPPPNLREEEFRSYVASRLLEIDVVVHFDQFVAKPRRFGEMSAWFCDNYGDLVPSHDAGQRVAQQMIRWLSFFLPERYTLETPNYSEIFQRNA